MPEPVIVAAGRSAIGRAKKGSLVDCRPDDLGSQIVRQVIDSVPELAHAHIEELVLGCAQPAGESGYNLARVVAVLSGLTDVPGMTVNRFCASSLDSIRIAANAIRADEGDIYIAAGVETVSRYPFGWANSGSHNVAFAEAEARSQARLEPRRSAWTPGPGLPNIYLSMGETAENVAEVEGITRAEMDEFAVMSQERAVRASANGVYDAEILPVTLADGSIFAKDDGPRPGTTVERLAELRPAFRQDGLVTAGNSCPLNDGAAAVIVMSDVRAAELGISPLARVVASAATALNPEIMGMGPLEASRLALMRSGLSIDDIDLVEINEAFAAQVIPVARKLGVDFDRLNVHGGAIALGHPFGMTGARIMTTLLNGLKTTGGRYGLESMCTAGGQGVAMIVERLT